MPETESTEARIHDLKLKRRLSPPSQLAVIGIIVARNEILRLPDVFRHYRKLGLDRFAVIDNGSTDGTPDYLRKQPDVDVWSTTDSFAQAAHGMMWRQFVVSHYGTDRWYLIIDADELLVFSGMQKHDIHDLCARLDKLELPAMRAPMIDMYSDKPADEVNYEMGQSLIEQFPFFDSEGYRMHRFNDGKIELVGGPRSRLLSDPRQFHYHCLEKYPLRFWKKEFQFDNIHRHSHMIPGTLPLGVLLHFKLANDFEVKVDTAVLEKQHWRSSMEYIKYQANMELLKNPHYQSSMKYAGPETLIDCRLMVPIPWG
jgi:Glycosyl transferase family 2